jgi:hypothetical protein
MVHAEVTPQSSAALDIPRNEMLAPSNALTLHPLNSNALTLHPLNRTNPGVYGREVDNKRYRAR